MANRIANGYVYELTIVDLRGFQGLFNWQKEAALHTYWHSVCLYHGAILGCGRTEGRET